MHINYDDVIEKLNNIIICKDDNLKMDTLKYRLNKKVDKDEMASICLINNNI